MMINYINIIGTILIILFLSVGIGHAQYVPIPNETSGAGCTNGDTTQCAGYKFRADINNKLSGASTSAPTLVPYTFAALPTEVNGQSYYCSDCTINTSPCTGSGTGAIAQGINGQYVCGGASGGGALPSGSIGQPQYYGTSNSFGGSPNPLKVEAFSGATLDVKLSHCFSALGNSIGTCDASGLPGPQSIAANLTIPDGVTVVLGPGTYTVANGDAITVNTEASLLCQSGERTNINGNVAGPLVTMGTDGGNQHVADCGINNSNTTTGSATVPGATSIATTQVYANWERLQLSSGYRGAYLNGAFYGNVDVSCFVNNTPTCVYAYNTNSMHFTRVVDVTGGAINVDFEGQSVGNVIDYVDSENLSSYGVVTGLDPTLDGGITAFIVTIKGGYCENLVTAHCLSGSATSYINLSAQGVRVQGADRGCQGSWVTRDPSIAGCLGEQFGTLGNSDQQMQIVGAQPGWSLSNTTNVLGDFTPWFHFIGNPNTSADLALSVYDVFGNGLAQPLYIAASQQIGLGPAAFAAPSAGIDLDAGTNITGTLTTSQMATPIAPTVSTQGTTGATSYTYYLVANDGNGGQVLSSSTTINNGNASLSVSNYNRICATREKGVLNWDVLKTNTSTYLGTIVYNTTHNSGDPYPCITDTGQGTANYTAPTTNTSGGATIHGTLATSQGNNIVVGSNANFGIGTDNLIGSSPRTSIDMSIPVAVASINTSTIYDESAPITRASKIEGITMCVNGTVTCSGAPTVFLNDCGGTINSCSSPVNLATSGSLSGDGCVTVTITHSIISAGDYLSPMFASGTCSAFGPLTAHVMVRPAPTPTIIFLTSGSSFVTPSDWNQYANTIEVIGAGGGGATNNTTPAGGGGGGGAYSKIRNLALSGTVTYHIGVGGAANNTGTDTWFCNSSSNCATIGGSAVQVGAKAGVGASGSTGGLGGDSASGVGTTKFSGGAGASTAQAKGSGGGGAAGPNGAGGAGNAASSFAGGVGGQGDNGFGGVGGQPDNAGGNGTEYQLTPSYGSGGGGGGVDENIASNPIGGNYGGGGGGSENVGPTVGGIGANGLIVITYIPGP